jgi:FKBP-type peptidyl-prolyl cis-trans isomerase
MKLAITLLLLSLCLSAAVGCGGSSDPSTAASEAKPRDREPGPELEVPGGPPPKKLVVKDLKIGRGRPAKLEDKVTVQYIGKLWSGEPYSNSWRYSVPPRFTLGGGELIVGFDRGIRGMRAGGQRLLYVPRALDTFPGTPVTDGASALVFIAKMLRVRAAGGR